MSQPALVLDGQPVSVDDVFDVAVRRRPVSVGEGARSRMQAGREIMEQALEDGNRVYGLTTGFGAMKRVAVPPERQREFNRASVLSHLVGHGPLVHESVVRAAMMVRAQGFVQGRSAARPALADAYVAALNAGFHPSVRTVGSLGMSDLAPLGAIAAGLMGEGIDSEAFAATGLEPIVAEASEARAMMSANAFSVGWACVALVAAEVALDGLDAAAALSYEAVLANTTVIRPEIADVRPYPGARATAENLRRLLEGGELLDGKIARELQDPLSFRVVPQTHGAARDAFAHARTQLSIELASSGDNPFVSLTTNELVSSGNFDSTPIAIALDYARLGLAHTVTIAAERVQKLLDARFSGLATYLRHDDELDDGLTMLAYSSAAAAAELRLLAAPVSLETPTTSIDEGIDDRIVLTPLSSRRLGEMATLAHHVTAVELVCAAQGVDLRERSGRLGRGTTLVYEAVRELVPFTRAGEAITADLAPLEQRLAAGLPAGGR